ncbi:penicillin-binding protein activator [Frigidibacter oleivorans]|uniref:penicillin-binding protein activator n=1 Tax=Frigidibacter oleivorans TaxID=2487129 RepID=UPI000F8F06D7|nr:penicillin-binding protein activator [Frigidibacter oleivorans]
MIAFFRNPRKPIARLAGLASALWLAACAPTMNTGSGPAVSRGEAVPVALLLPGATGNAGDEVIGRSLRQAAQLAISDLQGVEIDLRVYDTGPSAAGAGAAASRAADEGAKIILGPVYAEAANAAGLAVAGRGINVLSFSNNTDIAGGNVFVLGPTFQNTANRLVSFARSQGRNRIMVVHDRNASGEAGRRAIETAIQRNGAVMAGTGSYDFSQQGVIAAVPQIVSTAQASGADAMFLTADTAGALPLLSQLLPEGGLNTGTTPFIGLTRWDIPAQTLALPGLQGGWFALPDPTLSQQFQARYQAAYGEAPHPIAGLAYDGIAAIGALVRSNRSNPLSAAALTQGSGFVGVNGVFRLRGDGSNERGLAVAQIRNGQVVVVSGAPRSFGGAGF